MSPARIVEFALFLLILGIVQSDTPIQKVILLTSTFTSQDGTLTFRYPASWQVQEHISGLINISNWDVRPIFAEIVESGEVHLVIGLESSERLPESTLVDLLRQSPISTPIGEIRYGEPVAFSIGSRLAARRSDPRSVEDNLAIKLLLNEDVIASASIRTYLGELTQFEPIILAILASAEYRPPAFIPPLLDEETTELACKFTSDDNGYSFGYPCQWSIHESINHTYLDLAEHGLLASRSARIAISTYPISPGRENVRRTALESLEASIRMGRSSYGAVIEFISNGREAARVVTCDSNRCEMVIFIFLNDDLYALISGRAKPHDEYATLVPMLLALVDSIETATATP